MSRILFVYPNREGYPIIPLGISVLAGVAKKENHNIDLFDVTFMMPERLDHMAREKTQTVLKVDFKKYWGSGSDVDINEEFRKKILSFNPDLIAFSIVENNYGCSRELFKIAKKVTNSPIIAGGIFPTVAPNFFIEDDNVDLVCIGEGEYALSELARKLDNKEDFSNISNCIVKRKGRVVRNDLANYYNWEPLTYQEWEIFDKRHLFKAFMGKMWRTGFFEMSRGCPFDCSYCVNFIYQKLFKCLGKYHREKPLEYVIKEIEYMRNTYSLELIFFNDENFMMMAKDRFEEFCTKFKKMINLPFFIQTRAENLLDERKVIMLKESNCVAIGIGVESGNQKIRREILKKNTPDDIYIRAFANCNKYNLRTTAYVMVGLPFETAEDILLTAEFCKRIKATSVGLAIFAPYHGSKLYDLCVKEGFIKNGYNENITVNYSSILKMPQLSKEKLEELYYGFNDLVFKDKEAINEYKFQ